MANTISINWQGPGFYFKNKEGVMSPVSEVDKTKKHHGALPGRTYVKTEDELKKFIN